MSEHLRIFLDRPDRTYETDGVVEGRVLIATERGERCRSVTLTRYWKTHGKGNTTKGGELERILHQGPLEGPGPWTLPFTLPAPSGPFTHRGEYLNVDHYVRVDVDIPWALDPEAEEEYILRPGAAVPEPPPELLRERSEHRRNAVGCRRVLGILFLLVGVVTLPLGLVFMAVGVLFLVPDVRRRVAGLRVGDVAAHLDRRRLVPGGEVEVRVRASPSREVRLAEATAVLRCREVCVSGHGTDRTTHTKVLHETTRSLEGPRVLLPGQTARLAVRVDIPEDAAWSFTASDNEVEWDVVVRLHIPSWPDWVEEIPVVVWPTDGRLPAPGDERREALAGGGVPPESRGPSPLPVPPETPRRWKGKRPFALTPPPGGRPDRPPRRPPELPGRGKGTTGGAAGAGRKARPTAPPEPATDPSAVEAGGERPASPPEPATDRSAVEAGGEPTASPAEPVTDRSSVEAGGEPGASPLVALVRGILTEPSSGDRRKERVDALVGSRQEFEVQVERSERSFGVWTEPEYRDGSTVVGTVADSEVQVLVRFPATLNDAVRSVERGERRPVRGTVVEWERLRERVVVHAAEAPGPPV